MNVLSLTGVRKILGGEPLFEEVTLGIDAGDKIGLIGKNGCGKSTFLKLLSGELEPDAGLISRNRELTISTLEQRFSFGAGMTMEDFLFSGDGPLIRLAREYRMCLRDMHDGKENEKKLSELTRRMEHEGGFSLEHTFRSICRELGLEETGAPISTLSGGMVRKAALARCLASGASFMTLDEPTNHLDLDAILWLEKRLKDSTVGFVLVTHDRYFLDSVCTSILEIDRRRIDPYPGNYSSYLAKKAERQNALERAEQRRSSILRNELEWLKRGPRARTGKDKGRKARIENLMEAGVEKELSMREFSSTHRRLGKKVLELHGISKSYGGRQIIRPFSYSFRRGERIGMIGPNGSGKTTFLDLIAGRVPPDSGSAVKGENTVFAYFDQTGSFVDGKLTVVEYMKEQAEWIHVDDQAVLSAEQFLERFLFPRPMFSLALERLSGGEFRRLHLIRLLAMAPNFLLLDEPTNDLDIDTIRVLEQYLADFTGCILLISHDRALLDRLTDYLFIFDGSGGIRGFVGNYDEYRQMVREQKGQRIPPPARGDRRKPGRHEQRNRLSFRERQEYDGILDEIAGLEEERKELEAAFAQAVQDPAEAGRRARRYREVIALVEEKMARWEELAMRAEET
jgi:ATP-binding cassette subfamily F protein uup